MLRANGIKRFERDCVAWKVFLVVGKRAAGKLLWNKSHLIPHSKISNLCMCQWTFFFSLINTPFQLPKYWA